MPSPVLQFKRGNAASLNFGLRAGEPAITLDTNDFYVGIDSTLANNKFYGSSRYWSKETTSKGSGVNLVEGTTNGSQYITLKSPDILAGITTYTFPATPTDGYFLKTNGSGTLSWDQVISDFYIAADSGSPDTVSTGSTITFVGGTNVNTAVTDQTITINLDSGITLTNVNATGIVTAATLAGVTTVDATTKATLEAIIGSEPNTFSNLLVTGISTFNGNVIADSGLTVGGILDANGGATIDNIQIGITNNNKIDTVSGVLELDSAAGKVVVQDNVEIYGNLDISGNVSVGGSAFTITTSDLYVASRDIVVGYTTTQQPTDNTANHGGIAIASTEGTPLVSFSLSGINTLPDTYKQMMWFQSGTLGFQEDMFAFNYGVAVGTTVTPLGTRLAVGTGITMSDTDIKATNFYGSLVGDASGADKVKTIDASNANTNYYLTFVDSNNGSATNETVYTDSSITYNASANKLTTQSAELGANLLVSGITTLAGNVTVSGVATFPNSNVYINNELYVGGLQITGGGSIGLDIVTRNLSVSGVSTFVGFATFSDRVSVANSVTANLFDSSNTALQAPTIGNYAGERLRLYDFDDPSNTNYAIGAEGSHIWFGVDANNDAQGFKWYGETTQVMRLGGTGNLILAGNLDVRGGISTVTALNATGNVTLGDSSSDTLTVNATATFAEPIVGTIGTATRATTVDTTATSSDAYYYVPFVDTLAGQTGETIRVGAGLSINPYNGNVGVASVLSVGSVNGVNAFIKAGGGSNALYMYSNGDVSFQAKAIVNEIRSSNNATTLITLNGLDATFANNVTVTGIATAASFSGPLTGNVTGNINSSGLSTFSSINVANINSSLGVSALAITGASGAVVAYNDLTVSGNLYVNGNTTQINTTEVTVEDRTITLGIQTGFTPTTTTWDLGVMMNYGDAGIAKTAGVIWQYSNERFVFAANSDNPISGNNTTTPVITVANYAPIEIGALWVNDCAGQSQVISCTGGERFLENITVDAGTF